MLVWKQPLTHQQREAWLTHTVDVIQPSRGPACSLGEAGLSCQDCSEGRISDALVCVPHGTVPSLALVCIMLSAYRVLMHFLSAISAPYMLFLYLYAIFMGRLLILCLA